MRKESQTVREPKLPAVLDSLAQAEAIWGIDRREMIRAKHAGCAAFRNGKIQRDPLLDWLKANPRSESELAVDAGNLSLQDQKLQKQIEKLDIEIAKSRGELVEKAAVTEEWGKHMTRIFDILDKSLKRDEYNLIAKEVRGYLGKYSKEI